MCRIRLDDVDFDALLEQLYKVAENIRAYVFYHAIDTEQKCMIERHTRVLEFVAMLRNLRDR